MDILATGVAPANGAGGYNDHRTPIKLGAATKEGQLSISGNIEFGRATLVEGKIRGINSIQFFDAEKDSMGTKTYSVEMDNVRIRVLSDCPPVKDEKGISIGLDYRAGKVVSDETLEGVYNLQVSKTAGESALSDLSVGSHAGFVYMGLLKSKGGFNFHHTVLIGDEKEIGKGLGTLRKTYEEKVEVPGASADGKRTFRIVGKDQTVGDGELGEGEVTVEEIDFGKDSAPKGDLPGLDDRLTQLLAIANTKFQIKEQDKALEFLATIGGCTVTPENYEAIYEKLNA